MSYATTNPPVLLTQGIGYQTGARIWFYKSADAGSDVDADGYSLIHWLPSVIEKASLVVEQGAIRVGDHNAYPKHDHRKQQGSHVHSPSIPTW